VKINRFADNTDFDVGFAKLPGGSEGRKSMFNGLADSIWVGTQHPEEAWQWVKFLASPECQNITIMTPVMDSIMLDQAQAVNVLPLANQEVNALFK
jgi:ABC-type glycerol-3-phosphate transport system substrate-binding protein